MTVTYYLEILSSWCHWAEPAWADLKRRYEGRVRFEWRIALMNPAISPRRRPNAAGSTTGAGER